MMLALMVSNTHMMREVAIIVTHFVFNANSAKFPVSTTVVGIPASLAALSTRSLALLTGI